MRNDGRSDRGLNIEWFSAWCHVKGLIHGLNESRSLCRSESASGSFTATGLVNRRGDYNCFLNVIIQVWGEDVGVS